MTRLGLLPWEKVALALDKKRFQNKKINNMKTINNHSKKIFVLVVFFFTLVVYSIFFDIIKNENKAKAEECSEALDVMIVIDRSESMNTLEDEYTRMSIAKEAALDFITNLNSDNDRVGFVKFANSAEMPSGLTSDFENINTQINLLEVEEGGQTNTEAALVQAREELLNYGRSSVIKVLIILSDGIPNRSITASTDPVGKAILAATAAKTGGIRIISIGLGIPTGDEAEIFMQEIASAPGDYYSSEASYPCEEINYLVCVYNEISASICDGNPPLIVDVAKNREGTLYSRDDLIIVSHVSDDFGIKEHKIKWSTNNWVSETVELCNVYTGSENICEKNIGTFGEGMTVNYKSYVLDTNNNEAEGTEDGTGFSKSVKVASATMEINGDVNGKFQRNQNNSVKINISDPQGMANNDEFYVSILGTGLDISDQVLSSCTGDGSNWSCSNDFVFYPICGSIDLVDVSVYPQSSDNLFYPRSVDNFITMKNSVEIINSVENLLDGKCEDEIDNDCDTTMDSGEPECDIVAPVVSIERKVLGVPVVDIYNNNSVVLSSTAVDYPLSLNGLISHTIYWYENGILQSAQSCGSEVSCSIVIGTFPTGTEIKYYVRATDSSVSANFACDRPDCATYENYYSFIVKDFECEGEPNLVTTCSTGGVCCNNICDTTQSSNLFDDECSVAGCNLSSWEWVVANEGWDCDDGTDSDGCYAVGDGCEERDYFCSSGFCSSYITNTHVDSCVGFVRKDYGCNPDCEIVAELKDPICDILFGTIFVVANDSDGFDIDEQLVDSMTDSITLVSITEDDYDSERIVDQHKIFWTIDDWGTTNEINCGGIEECTGVITGPLSIGTIFQYYSWAEDMSGNEGETAMRSFSISDATCNSASDMTSCTISGNSGKCCNSLCDTSFDITTLYDAECMVGGCNAESWEYVPTEDGVSCNIAEENSCFTYFSGCEKRDYSCDTGICLHTTASFGTDICSGDTFVDYGCSGADCSSSDNDCSDCSCSCGSYNLDEKIYSSLSFDGDGDFVEIPNDLSLNITGDKISISAWVFVGNQVSDVGIITKGPSVNTERYMLGITNDEKPRMRVYTGSYTQAVADNALTQNEWYYLVGTYDGSNIKIYVDGSVAKSIPKSGNLSSSLDPVVIGRRTLTDDRFYNGLIDEARIYNRALSEDEVLQHYQGVYQNESGLVSHWKFDDVNITAFDNSGNGNNGVLVNGPTWATSFDNVNNVPSYWRTCSDDKDNDCNSIKDGSEVSCDGELDVLEVLAKYGPSEEYQIADGDEIYLADFLGTLKIKSETSDVSGINSHSVHWKINGLGATSKSCFASGSCEIDETDLGVFSTGDVIEYKSYAVDTNNNSACDPVDCSEYYSFILRDNECYDIINGVNIDGPCEATGECCGGICDISFDASNAGGYDEDCRIEGCNGESWELIPKNDETSCNEPASGLCTAFSASGCETTDYQCFSGLCEYKPINQKMDYCFDGDFFKDFSCDVSCNSIDDDCSDDCSCSCNGYNLEEKFYSSLSFDGVDDYVEVSDDSSLNISDEISVEVWVKDMIGTGVNYNANTINDNDFVSKIRATIGTGESDGDYDKLSTWEAAIQSNLILSSSKVFSVSDRGTYDYLTDDGQAVTFNGGGTGTLKHLNTSNKAYIVDVAGTVNTGTVTINSTGHIFTISDIGQQIGRAIAECYNDWPTGLDDNLSVIGWITDSDNYIKIYAPVLERHSGKVKADGSYTGFALMGSGGTKISISEKYTEIDGIILDSTVSYNTGIGTTYSQGNFSKVSNCIFQNFGVPDVAYRGLTVGDYMSAYIFNNIFIKSYLYVSNTASSSNYVWVYNNTFYNCHLDGGNDNRTIAKNNIIYFSGVCYQGNYEASSSNNISVDATAPGVNSLINKTLGEIAFVDTSAAAEDLHLQLSSHAINAGINLQDDISSDIDGNNYLSLWDIGADEFLEGVIISKGIGENAYSLTVDGDGNVYGNINDQNVSAQIAGNNWYQVILIYDGNNQKLYLDGNEVDSKALVSAININVDDLIIGNGSAGMIDEVRIYNRVIFEDEALQHFQGIYQDESGLVGHWKFDDTVTVSTATDSSGNSNHGTLNGPTWSKSFNDTNNNNVPGYWQACSDAKDNDCNSSIDEEELACDGELDSSDIEARNQLNSVLIDGQDDVEDSDIISLIARPIDSSGIKNVTIYWTDDNYLTTNQKTCGFTGDDFEDDETCLLLIDSFDAGDVVKYKAQGFDNNNNSKCDPIDCSSSYSFNVIFSNQPPEASDLKVRKDESYCSGLNYVTFQWSYYDPDELVLNTQHFYRVQIKKKTSEFDDPENAAFFDSGLFLDAYKEVSTHSYTFDPVDAVVEDEDYFEYNSTYYWRVQVVDYKGAVSAWEIYNRPLADDGDTDDFSFSTPLHQYPEPNFDFLPVNPNFGDEIIITENSHAYDADGAVDKWQWDFENGSVDDLEILWSVTPSGDTTYIYTNPSLSQYNIKLTVTDSDTYQCSQIKLINVGDAESYPKWNEIAPGN